MDHVKTDTLEATGVGWLFDTREGVVLLGRDIVTIFESGDWEPDFLSFWTLVISTKCVALPVIVPESV